MDESELLQIFTLGDLRILRGGKLVKSLRSRKAQALMVYLACTSKPHPREALADLFWSESSPTQAMSNLRDVIHALRKHLKPFVDITRYSITLNPEMKAWIDVAELETALAAMREDEGAITVETVKKIEEALELYQKDFLEGFYVRGARGFEEWLVVERERIRLATLDALISLVKHHAKEGNYRKGIHYARRTLELEPLMEVGHQQLMCMLASSGRSSEALIQYKTCQQILQKELGVEPSQETKDIYNKLLKGERIKGTREALRQHNIRFPLTKLIGRQEEIIEIKKQLNEPNCRMLTLVGVGGIGKTQLGLHCAAEMLDTFKDGVWIVELAPLNENEILPDEIAAVFGVTAQEAKSGIGVTEILVDFLKEKSLLLVLDNCEHLIDDCARFAEMLLKGCSKVKILATSREVFGIKEECLYQVSPLEIPPRKTVLTKLESYPAVQLFLERAKAVRPQFELKKESSDVLIDVSNQIEGIPLAIELAAARVKVMSIEQIAERLNDRFRILTGGPRTALPRHQTLKATMDWSYGLLTELEQMLLGRLSVFSGGWTLKAAEEITSFGHIEKKDVLDLLSQLIEKSLVLTEEQSGKIRYKMLETVRQYGTQKLSEKDETEDTKQRHATYFVQLAESIDEGLRDSRQMESLAIFDSDHDNLRSALRFALNSGKVDLAYRLVGALGWYWFMRGYWKESWRWMNQVMELGKGSNPQARAKAICRSGGLEIIRGNMVGTVELIQEVIDICREINDNENLAWGLNLMGQVKSWTSEDANDGIPFYTESGEIFSSLNNKWGTAWAQRYIGQIYEYLSKDYSYGIKLLNDSAKSFERIGDIWNSAHSLYLLGQAAIRHKDYELAEDAYMQCLEKCNSVEDKVMEAHALRGLAQLSSQLGDRVHSERLFFEAIEALQKIGDDNCIAQAYKGLGELAIEFKDFPKAAQYLRQSLVTYQKLGLKDYMVMLIERFAKLAVAIGKGTQAAKLMAISENHIGDVEILPEFLKNERNDLLRSISKLIGKQEQSKILDENLSLSLEEGVKYALEENGE